MSDDIKRKKISPLQAIAVVESALKGNLIRIKAEEGNSDNVFDIDEELQRDRAKVDQFEALFTRITKSMSNFASHAFFDETIGYELKTERLARILVPFMEKGLIKAFKSKQGLKTFLVNLGYLPDDDED